MKLRDKIKNKIKTTKQEQTTKQQKINTQSTTFDQNHIRISFLNSQSKTQLAEIKITAQWIQDSIFFSDLPKLKLNCTWFRKTINNMEQIKIKTPNYQLGLQDIGTTIQVQCLPQAQGKQYQGMPFIKTIGPIQLDKQTQQQSYDLFQAKKATFSISFNQLNLKSIEQDQTSIKQGLVKIINNSEIQIHGKRNIMTGNQLLYKKRLFMDQGGSTIVNYPQIISVVQNPRMISILLNEENDFLSIELSSNKVKDVFILLMKRIKQCIVKKYELELNVNKDERVQQKNQQNAILNQQIYQKESNSNGEILHQSINQSLQKEQTTPKQGQTCLEIEQKQNKVNQSILNKQFQQLKDHQLEIQRDQFIKKSQQQSQQHQLHNQTQPWQIINKADRQIDQNNQKQQDNITKTNTQQQCIPKIEQSQAEHISNQQNIREQNQQSKKQNTSNQKIQNDNNDIQIQDKLAKQQAQQFNNINLQILKSQQILHNQLQHNQSNLENYQKRQRTQQVLETTNQTVQQLPKQQSQQSYLEEIKLENQQINNINSQILQTQQTQQNVTNREQQEGIHVDSKNEQISKIQNIQTQQQIGQKALKNQIVQEKNKLNQNVQTIAQDDNRVQIVHETNQNSHEKSQVNEKYDYIEKCLNLETQSSRSLLDNEQKDMMMANQQINLALQTKNNQQQLAIQKYQQVNSYQLLIQEQRNVNSCNNPKSQNAYQISLPQIKQQIKQKSVQQLANSQIAQFNQKHNSQQTKRISQQLTVKLNNQISQKLTKQLTQKLTKQLTRQLTIKLTQQLTQQLTLKLNKQISSRLTKQIQQKLTVSLTDKLTKQITVQLTKQLTIKLTNSLTISITKQLQPRIAEQLRPKITEQLRPKITQQVRPKLMQQLRPKLTQQLRPKIKEQLIPKLTQQLTPKLTQQLRPKLIQQLTINLTSQLSQKLRKQLPLQIRQIKLSKLYHHAKTLNLTVRPQQKLKQQPQLIYYQNQQKLLIKQNAQLQKKLKQLNHMVKSLEIELKRYNPQLKIQTLSLQDNKNSHIKVQNRNQQIKVQNNQLEAVKLKLIANNSETTKDQYTQESKLKGTKNHLIDSQKNIKMQNQQEIAPLNSMSDKQKGYTLTSSQLQNQGEKHNLTPYQQLKIQLQQSLLQNQQIMSKLNVLIEDKQNLQQQLMKYKVDIQQLQAQKKHLQKKYQSLFTQINSTTNNITNINNLTINHNNNINTSALNIFSNSQTANSLLFSTKNPSNSSSIVSSPIKSSRQIKSYKSLHSSGKQQYDFQQNDTYQMSRIEIGSSSNKKQLLTSSFDKSGSKQYQRLSEAILNHYTIQQQLVHIKKQLQQCIDENGNLRNIISKDKKSSLLSSTSSKQLKLEILDLKKLANKLTESLTEKDHVIENMRLVNKELNSKLLQITKQYHQQILNQNIPRKLSQVQK